MPQPLKLVQLTDPHLCARTDAVLHGWHVQRAWRRVFHDAMTHHPDAAAWILSGDLVDDESVAGYRRVNAELADLHAPVMALAGNHDDPAAMRRHLTHAHVHTRLDLGGWQLHALDSHIDGSDAGRLGARQLRMLDAQLGRHDAPAVVFVHHPPMALHSHWLDAIGLQDGAALRERVRAHPHVAAVVCGHAHQAHASHIGQARCWVTPSSMRQFLPGSDTFALDTDATPGYRVLHLDANGRVSSYVRRLPSCG